jgi:hypothetical protein
MLVGGGGESGTDTSPGTNSDADHGPDGTLGTGVRMDS